MARIIVYTKRALLACTACILLLGIILHALWNDRPSIDDIGWPTPAEYRSASADTVTVTWLGVATLLFDDGETQILIDGFFSRPTLADIVLRRQVDNDAAGINSVLNEYRIRRLAAIVPAHSHFDHAMDIGAIANRSSASVIGTESTANIARGAGVPEDQIVVAEAGAGFEFGKFTVRLHETPHAPLGWRGSVPMDGVIDQSLEMPQPISAFRMGGAWSIFIEHPQGTALVQASSGFNKYALRDVHADVAFISTALLEKLGRDFSELFWQHTVTATGARSVYPIHFDDFTKPFGTVELPPWFMNDSMETFRWLEEFRDRWDSETALFLPEFGKPIAIYAHPSLDSGIEITSSSTS